MNYFGMLEHHLEEHSNVLGWFYSRKYNGESVLWDGGITRDRYIADLPWSLGRPGISTGLWSLGRSNKPNIIHAPSSFLDLLPIRIPLHGEIWSNDSRDIPSSVCKTKEPSPIKWSFITFIPFNIKPYYLWDLPKHICPSGIQFYYDTNFETKIDIMKSLKNKIITPIEYHRICFKSNLLQAIELAKNLTWEGLCFNNPYGHYELKRSYDVLKWKPLYNTEVVIVGYEDGKTGKNINKVGALKVRLTWDDKILSIFGGKEYFINKTVFFDVCGLNEEERDKDTISIFYHLGKEIKISFNGVTSYGIPLHANIQREKITQVN